MCQAVVAGNTIYLRGQVAEDLDTGDVVAPTDPAAQTHWVIDNIALLLDEAGAGLEHLVTYTVYLTDLRHREAVSRVLGERLAGTYPAVTAVVVESLARPEWLVEVSATAVLPWLPTEPAAGAHGLAGAVATSHKPIRQRTWITRPGRGRRRLREWRR
jgi:enamine deaminase RidA (YjgF/YER057c/UK114 family)